MTRTETALHLRDHALSLARQHGTVQQIGDAKFLRWQGDPFGILLRTPFQKWETGPDVAARSLAATHEISVDHAKYAATLHGLKLPEVLPYCIDIWRGKKAMSLEWVDDGRSCIISFKRGPWESEFLALSLGEMAIVSKWGAG